MTRTTPNADNTPSKKFFPPPTNSSRFLLRTELLTIDLHSALNAARVITIEAQAGQGKSVLASQFLNYNQLNHLWYHIGPEDTDPFLILDSILFNLREKFPELKGTELDTILSKGKVGPLDIQRCVNMLVREIETRIPGELFIVFDDVHLLFSHRLACSLLDHLIDTSPPRLRFILTSRTPLKLNSKVLRSSGNTCRLTTEDIAFRRHEIEEYFTAVLKIEIDKDITDDIFRATGGWAMGVVLAGDALQRNRYSPENESPFSAHSRKEQIFDFFQQEILPHVPADLHINFHKFSFLSEVPVELAGIISGRQDIEHILDDMAYRNLFVYRKKRTTTTFYFHESYREFLQKHAADTLSHNDIGDLLRSETTFYCKQGLVDKAVICCAQNKDYATIDNLLASRGSELLISNSTINILSAIESIPETTILHRPWIALYMGLLRAEFMFHTTLTFFEAARKGFMASGEEDGESVSIAMIIFFHIIVSGNYRAGTKLLPRLDELLSRRDPFLPYSMHCLAARYLAFGHFLFTGNTAKALSSLNLPENTKYSNQHPSSVARCRFIRGYIELFAGKGSAFLREAEICFKLLHDPRVGTSDKLMIRILFLSHLSMRGDQLNFSAEKLAIEQAIRPEILYQTVAASNIHAWESSILFAAGRTGEALELLEEALSTETHISNPHMRSQLLQWKAFGHALSQHHEISLNCIEESIRLREEAGGTIHLAFNTIIAGAVYSRLGLEELAESCFEKGIHLSASIPSSFFLVCAYLNRSYHKLLHSGPAFALDDLRTGLVLMRFHDLEHFWSWEPVMMGRLLSLAAHKEVEKDFSCSLARKKLDICLDNPDDPLPQLHFYILDHFRASFRSQTILGASDLSPSHRELLGILLTTKGQKISQEQIQLALWPDSTPVNARRSFDTLMTRLRQRLGENLPVSVKKYMPLKKGILELQHTHTDAVQFLALVKSGLRHARNREPWQAGNVFRQAFELLHGLWPEETFCSDKVVAFTSQLISALSEATISWAEIMSRSGNIRGAIALVERTLHIHFDDERLISLLYSLYEKSHNRLKARDILRRYREALKRLDYTDEEIDELQEDIISFSLKSMKNE